MPRYGPVAQGSFDVAARSFTYAVLRVSRRLNSYHGSYDLAVEDESILAVGHLHSM
jgi:hypothetical protein